MKWLTCEAGALRVRDRRDADAPRPDLALDPGTVNELLFDESPPAFAAMAMLPKALQVLVWLDTDRTLYPPAIASQRLYVLRPDAALVTATAVECLRCRGVSAVVAVLPGRLSRVEARRLQLAAERGNTTAVLLRDARRSTDIYAAATRWRVAPAPGDRLTQRWTLTLVHGHGRQVGQSYLLERSRVPLPHSPPRPHRFSPVPVHPPAALVHRPSIAASA